MELAGLMTQRATLEALTRSAQCEVTVDVDGIPMSFLVRKLKTDDRKRLQHECIDEAGMLDLDHAARLACQMCVIEPALSADVVGQLDIDVFLTLAQKISEHTGLSTMAQAVTPDPEEGSDVVKSFPAQGSGTGVAGGVDEAADHAGAGLDAAAG